MAKKAPKTTSEFLDILSDFLADTSDQSLDEVEAELREEGIDPEAAANRIQQVVDAELEKYRLKWQEEAKAKRAQAIEERKNMKKPDLPRGREALKQAINTLLKSPWGRQQQLASAYRNWEDSTEEDLASLLVDLKRLQATTEDHADDQESQD